MPPRSPIRREPDPEFRYAVARLRVALAQYRVRREFDRLVQQAETESRKTDPRIVWPADPLTN